MMNGKVRQLSANDVVKRIRARPTWLLHDLAPSKEEVSAPREYVGGMRLWYRLRQDGHTMLGCRRGRYLYRLSQLADELGVPGDLVDCGVWNGGSTVLLSQGAPSRNVWAFDSFEGLPEPTERDGDRSAGWKGACEGSEEMVRRAFRTYGNIARLKVVKGWFQDTFPKTAPEIETVAVLHADGDWYDSVLLTLETFGPKLSPGGVTIVDDYGHWDGARQAADDFRRMYDIDTPVMPIDGNAVYWKSR